jgi:hypothetical protein
MKRHRLPLLCYRVTRCWPFFAGVLASLLLMAPLFQTAHAYRFEQVTDFEGWWEWKNSPNVGLYYFGDSVKIDANAISSEDYACGCVGQDIFRHSIGAMSTVTIGNAVGYADAGLQYLNIGKSSGYDLEAQIRIEKWLHSDSFFVRWVVAENRPDGWHELESETIGEAAGSVFTIALARIGNEILFFAEGCALRVYSPEFDMGPQGYNWDVKAWSSPGARMEATFSDIFNIETGEPRPTITANGSGIPTSVSPATPVSIDIALDPGDEAGVMADWWVAVETPFPPPNNWYTYVYPTGWQPGVHLCAQTPLFDLSSPVNVLNATLPEGDYTFYFAVDNNADGIPNATWMDTVPVSVCNPTFYDTFDGLFLDGDKWDLNAIWNGNDIDDTEYFHDPYVSAGNLFFQGKDNLPLLKNNNHAYMGMQSLNRILQGNFELTLRIEDLEITRNQPEPGEWWGGAYLELAEERNFGPNGSTISIHICRGASPEYYAALALHYNIDGVPQDIGCPFVGGTHCWLNDVAVEGDKSRITVRRIGGTVTVYYGDTLFHTFDGATTEDLYIIPTVGLWNEFSGTFSSYHAEIPEVWVFPK